jgi:ACT domain-containing protein
MTVKQVSVFVENRPGALLNLTDALSRQKIDMRALCMAESSEFGVLRLIVDDPDKAAEALARAGYVLNITPVLAVAIPDKPGGLTHILSLLQENDINIEYTYAFLGGKNKDCAYMIFRVEDNRAAADVLVAKGIRLVEQDELSNL